MKYVILVSHGKFAEGLANALSMLVGKREDIIAVGLEDGKAWMNLRNYLLIR